MVGRGSGPEVLRGWTVMVGSGSGFLLTSHGSTVHMEEAGPGLRHGPCPPASRTLVLHVSGPAAWLIVIDPASGAARGCVVPTGQGQLRLAGMDRQPDWRLRPAGPWIEIVSDQGALREDEQGGVSLVDATQAGRFCVVALEAMRCMDALLGQIWLRRGAPRPVRARLDFAASPILALDDVTVDPTGLPGPFVTRTGALRDISVVAQGGRVLRLVLYNPVICFAVFGSDDYYEVLRLALHALHRHGGYDGAVCLAADRPAEAVARLVPAALADRWRHVASSPGLFTRYDLPAWELEAHQPVVYMDADVVANAPLRPLLARLALSRRVHMATEDRLFAHVSGLGVDRIEEVTDGWFGAWLFRGDPRLSRGSFALGSSGIMAADHVSRMRPLCDLVQRLRHAVPQALVDRFTDQALANYALHALGTGDFKTLDDFVDFARDAESAPAERRGLLHFHSGVGHPAPKLAAMQRYLAALDQAGR